jgi:hypothetical protein
MVKALRGFCPGSSSGSGVTVVYPSYAAALAAVPKTRKIGYDNPETRSETQSRAVTDAWECPESKNQRALANLAPRPGPCWIFAGTRLNRSSYPATSGIPSG